VTLQGEIAAEAGPDDAPDRRVWVPETLTDEELRLKEELRHAIVSPEVANELYGYLEDCFRRLLTTLSLVPHGSGRVLELGANPYFFTMLLRRSRRYELELANYFGGRGEAVQRAVDDRTGEAHEFRYREFNMEEEEFPYPDAHFDGVLYCEILEHLVRDPIAVFAEIHRVLKPGGWVIVTTPNVARRHNLMRLFRGQNLYDPYSGYGPYGRHNREYTVGELRELLERTGFAVERLVTRDLHPCSAKSKALALALGSESGFNLYALARRGPEFRWYYPTWLFRSGLPRRRVRDPWVRVGVNDSVQLGSGWWDVEQWSDGPMRWSAPKAEAFLRAKGGERLLRLVVWGGPKERRDEPALTLRLHTPAAPDVPPSTQRVRAGEWTSLEFRLDAPLDSGEVRVELDTSAFVPRDVLPGNGDSRQLGIGLRRIEACS
jgi:SAM-dependent methyltransferase